MKELAPRPVVTLTPRLLDIEAAAAYLGGVSTWTLRSWMADGLLQPVKLPGVKPSEFNRSKGRQQKETNRRLLFDRLDLDAFIESRRGA